MSEPLTRRVCKVLQKQGASTLNTIAEELGEDQNSVRPALKTLLRSDCIERQGRHRFALLRFPRVPVSPAAPKKPKVSPPYIPANIPRYRKEFRPLDRSAYDLTARMRLCEATR